MLRKLIIIILIGLASQAFAASPEVGAQVDSRLRHHMDRFVREPALSAEIVTIILEADTLPIGDVVAHNGSIRLRYGRLHEVSIPGHNLAALLAKLPANVVARFPYHHQAVAVTGQGVAKTGAADMQAMGKTGAGVKIGVIDLGFASLSSAQASGDLPATLTITDYTATGNGGIDHGTNVAQIVYEMAPGASLYLAKIDTEVQLAQALTDMAAAGVQVINHSVVWFGAAFYDGTGPICDIANSAADTKGAQWINAMGNHRQKHYLGTFTDTNSDLRHEFATGQNYNTISLTAGNAVSLILNWNAYPSTKVDYDLYLYNGNPDSGGVQVASSANRQAFGKGGTPIEAIDYTPSASGTYYIVVKKYNSSQPNLPLTLFSTGPDLGTKTTATSLLQPADCASVIGVGAVDLNDAVEYFSSEGPTTDGRAKPEISAPNRVQTSLSSSFAGTSAASPHAAGAAALLLANNPGMTPTQLRAALTAAVKDVNTSGFDYRAGYGRISLDADGDGLNHDAELAAGTSPTNPDTDGDGLSDWQEVKVYGTNPTISNQGDTAPRGAPNGLVNVADLLLLTRFVEGLDIPTALEKTLADMNGDGVLDVRDILIMRRNLGY